VSDKPSSLIADRKTVKVEPVERQDVFERLISFAYSPKSTRQSNNVDSWGDKHKTPPKTPRYAMITGRDRVMENAVVANIK
jgi:hypothetical protein